MIERFDYVVADENTLGLLVEKSSDFVFVNVMRVDILKGGDPMLINRQIVTSDYRKATKEDEERFRINLGLEGDYTMAMTDRELLESALKRVNALLGINASLYNDENGWYIIERGFVLTEASMPAGELLAFLHGIEAGFKYKK